MEKVIELGKVHYTEKKKSREKHLHELQDIRVPDMLSTKASIRLSQLMFLDYFLSRLNFNMDLSRFKT